MNKNITTDNWYAENHAAELDAALDSFDKAIGEAFGDEVAYIKHGLWSERVSFTTVKFADGHYIGFTVTPSRVSDGGYEAMADQLRRAFTAFGIELPYWMLRESC